MNYLKKKIVNDLIEKVGDLAEGLQSDVQLNPLGSILYYLNDYSEETRDVELFSSVLQAKISLLYKLLTRSNRYNPMIATYVLYLIELTEHMCNKFIKEKENILTEYERNDIKRISDIYLTNVGYTFYHIVSYGRNVQQDDVKKYLKHNAASFLDNRIRYRFENHKELREYYLPQYYRQRVYVGIFIFLRYYNQNALHPSLVNSIGLKLADIIDRGNGNQGFDIEEEYNKMIYDSMFIREVPFEHYDGTDLLTAETHVGGIYNFNIFWILLNLYRDDNLTSFRKSSNKFIPTKTDNRYTVLNDLIKTIDKLDENSIQKFSLILNKSVKDVNQSIERYKNHLTGLSNKT